MDELLKHFPTALKDPIALIGYVAALFSWSVVHLKVKRHQALLERIKELPEADRAPTIRAEMDAAIPPEVTPEDWLRSRIHRYAFQGFAILAAVVVVLAALVIYSPQRRNDDSLSQLPNSTLSLKLLDSTIADGMRIVDILDQRSTSDTTEEMLALVKATQYAEHHEVRLRAFRALLTHAGLTPRGKVALQGMSDYYAARPDDEARRTEIQTTFSILYELRKAEVDAFIKALPSKNSLHALLADYPPR
ncbi:hypothetical protein MCEMSE15_02183 [Fimbriimonadaceae bacterium]